MQQGLEFRRQIEIARLSPEGDVRHECGAAQKVLAGQPEFVVEENPPGGQQRKDEYGDQRRKQSTNASNVEVQDTETVELKIPQQNARDQVAGDREEYVDPDEAAGNGCEKRVVQDDRYDRDRAKPALLLPCTQWSAVLPWPHCPQDRARLKLYCRCSLAES